ncbi:MAG TPA: DUF1499 domain-containing protein [Longimicrobium sp.]
MGLLRALTTNRAFTDPEADDPRLRERSYSVPFAEVWAVALDIAQNTRGWTIVSSDPRAGEIVAEATTRLWGLTGDVWIRLSLDDEGQTRLEMASASRKGGGDLGTNGRRIARFLRSLDARLFGSKRANR